MVKTPNEFEILAREIAYQGYFRIDKFTLRYRRFSGEWSRPISREIFERGHAAAVLPYDPARDEVVLLEQFRAGAMEAPDGAWMLEPVAGIIEDDEDAAEVARREAVEEAGVDLGELIHMWDYLVSPGGTTESVSLYLGRVDAANAGGLFGLEHEAEDIRAFVLPFEAAMAELSRRTTVVASLVIAMQWLALNRDDVRRRWSSFTDI